MSKAAILTIFRVSNYGSVLQAYASQCLMERMGYDCVMIDYRYPNDWHYGKGAVRVYESPVKKLVKWVAGHFAAFPLHRLRHVISGFVQSRLHLTQPYDSLDALVSADWSEYDVVISGSDQVWNPGYYYGDSVFMLSFVPDGVRKVSLASSMAVDMLPVTLEDKYRSLLSRFAALSVRELQGEKIVLSQLGITVPTRVMLDPTLLLSAQEWLKALSVSDSRFSGRRYIFLYLLSYAFSPQPYIYEVTACMKERYGCDDVIAIGDNFDGIDEYLPGCKCVTGVSPCEFIRIVRDAECVVTSSFHGTAFAINFGRPLISVVNDSGDDRQSSLLHKLDIMNCCADMSADVESLNPEYEYTDVHQQLSRLRNLDIAWLDRAIKG